jgi:DNA-binding CsgD family transcriptional regulator
VTGPTRLARLGLDTLTEAVYRTLLSRPEWTLAELAGRLQLDPDALTPVVAQLVGLGLARLGERSELRAVSPRIGLAALVADREARLAADRYELEQSRLAAVQLAAEHEEPRRPPPAGSPDVVYGDGAVRARIAALVGTATTEVVSMSLSAAGYLDPVVPPPAVYRAVLARGAAYRALFFDRASVDEELARCLHELADAGALVRTAAGLPTSALVVDGRVAVLPVALSMTGRRPGVVLLRLPSVVTATVELFDRVWVTATRLARAGEAEPDGADGSEEDLLALLLAGSTDEAAAAQLGVSARTVRRKVSRLMESLDARSRFQAGAHAVERGWPAR